jgi:YfiR/HmsC-like
MRERRPMRAVCMLMVALAGIIGWVPVSASQLDEGLVKAAALVKVAMFVEWPAVSPTERFVIAVAGDEAFTAAVANFARGRRLQGRDIQVRQLQESDDTCACQLLFVGAREDSRTVALLRWARNKPILTIGETTAFLREGGIVRLFRDDDRLRLQINNAGAEGNGLKISSRLLQLGVRP